MAGGNFNPEPLRFGASNNTNLEALLNQLRLSMGTAFDVDRPSVTWVYLNAIARVMNDVFETNQKLANQWDPLRMTDFLERWEKILGLIPLLTDTLVDRRKKVLFKLQQVGKSGIQQILYDTLITILGNDVFISIELTNPNNPSQAIPGGANIPGGALIPDGDWFSSISYIAIKVQQPSYMDDGTFYDTVAQIFKFLDGLLPAWVTYNWFRESTPGTPGFILDFNPNLDNEAFFP